jgi:hypothetical protein
MRKVIDVQPVVLGLTIRRMKYLLMIVLIIVFALTCGGSYGGQRSDFVLTFNCGNDSPKLCLLGEIASGKSITLLSGKSSRICRAYTAGSFMYFFEEGDKDILSTHLRLECYDPRQYFLAYLGTGRVKYQLLELSLLEEKSKVGDFDSAVRREKLLEDEASIPTSPKVYLLPVSRKSILIGQYEAEGYNGYGPLFMSVQGKVEKIHFLASVYRVFRLNGRLYLMFYWRGSSEGSGSPGSALVELTEAGFKLIFEDDSWSTNEK